MAADRFALVLALVSLAAPTVGCANMARGSSVDRFHHSQRAYYRRALSDVSMPKAQPARAPVRRGDAPAGRAVDARIARAKAAQTFGDVVKFFLKLIGYAFLAALFVLGRGIGGVGGAVH